MSETNDLLIAALVKSQLEIKAPIKDKINPRFKTAYSSLDSIYAACRIPLAKNGLTISHSIESIEGHISLSTRLHHISGAVLSNRIPMFIDQQTSQGFASALTYARRYAVCSLLGLPTDDDDDGESATDEQSRAAPEPNLSKEQVIEIQSLIGEDYQLMQRILTAYSVDKFYDIPRRNYEAIKKGILARKAKPQEANV